MIDPDLVIEMLSDHLDDVSSRDRLTRPQFRIDDLRLAFELGERCGRENAFVDYAGHLKRRFISLL